MRRNTSRKNPCFISRKMGHIRLMKNKVNPSWQPNGNQMATNGYENGTLDLDIGLDLDIDLGLDNKKEMNKEKVSSETAHTYGEYKRVRLKDSQYKKLIDEFGEEKTNLAITKLDEYVQSNNNKNKYKDFYLLLRKVIKENWFKINDSEDFTSQSKRTIEFEDALHPKRRTAAGADSPYAKGKVPWEEL